jgi:hypothetical protein
MNCARTRKQSVTDRAKRYRANQPACLPSGPRKCAECGRSDVKLLVDHKDGYEEHGQKSNLQWLCRSCNNRKGALMAKRGTGRRTRQYNPKATGGAQSTAAYARAVSTHESVYIPGKGRVGAHDEGGAIIHATPKSKRREYAADIWAARKAHGNPKGRKRIAEKENLFGWSKKERTAKRKRHSAGATEARSAGYRYATHKSDENLSEWMDRKDFGDEKSAVKEKLAAAFHQGFLRGKNEEDRKEAIAKADAERRIKGFDRKIDSAEKKLDKAKDKKGRGGMSEAQFESVKARLEREIDKYEEGKRKAANPHMPVDEKGGTFKRRPYDPDKLKSYPSQKAYYDALKRKNPAVSAAQYRLAQAVLAGTAREQTRMTKKVARELIAKTPPKLRAQFMKVTGGTVNGVRVRNPEELDSKAAQLSEKFHGVPATTVRKVVEYRHRDEKLTELGDMVRLVIDTPTGKVVEINFATSGKNVVRLATRPVKNKAGKIIGKQLYFVGGDQEPNLQPFGLSNDNWVRDRMELGRLHHFPKSAKEGSIVYRTKKSFHNMKLTDYWHRPGEESIDKVGPAALPIVVYDHRNKKLELAGGNYTVDAPGIIN